MNEKLNGILLFVGISLIAVLLSGCFPVRVTGSGNTISRTYNYTNFNRIQIASGFTTSVKSSSTYSIEVTADDNLFDYISVKNDGGALSIGLKTGSYEQTHLKATILMPGLQGVDLSDGSRTEVDGFNSTNTLSIKLSDGSNLSGDLTAGNVDINLTDGSRIGLKGSGKDIKVVSHDGSRADLEDFSAVNADLNIGDGGTLTINLSGTLNANLSAGSHVTYTGNPTLGNINLSAGSTLNRG